MSNSQDVHPTYGVPNKMLSCPGCGRVYVGKVCLRCEECKNCCEKGGRCERPHYIPANQAKEHLAEHEKLPPCPD
jgi:hypothetical protein